MTTHCWSRRAEPSRADVSRVAAIPFIANGLRNAKPVCFTRLYEVPEAADRGFLQAAGSVARRLFRCRCRGSGHTRGAGLQLERSAASSGRPCHRAVQNRRRPLRPGVRPEGSVSVAADHARRVGAGPPAAQGDGVRLSPRTILLGGSRLVVSESPAVQRVLTQVEQVAMTPSTVLLLGETGVGKEVFAQAIHELSAKRHRPMIRVNCAAIPSALIESELFGHERGAFTGAVARQIGRFEAADDVDAFPRRNWRAAGRRAGEAAPRAAGASRSNASGARSR